MKILRLNEEVQTRFADKLAAFEAQFHYPLGDDQFSISHGEDYTAFYDAMGKAIHLIAVSEEQVIGAFSGAIRDLISPQSQQVTPIAYLGDLKVKPTTGLNSTYYRLATKMMDIVSQQASIAIGAVMQGNLKQPHAYTGAAGIPSFSERYNIKIVRFDTSEQPFTQASTVQQVSENEFKDHVTSTATEHYFLPKNLTRRSSIKPRYLISSGAHGILEDTRKAKLLHDLKGNEIKSAHLSYFDYATPTAGAELIHHAIRSSAQLNYPGLFTCMPTEKFISLLPYLKQCSFTESHATIFGNEFESALQPPINTSEI